ncbi:MAG: DUF11 domain-containing protein, partial [Planctomycetes bacterium]|nr:DUF11 domain-containing protein [Planctomycetota bacterium]
SQTYSLTVTDPGADTFTLTGFSCGTGGTPSNLAFDSATGAGGFDCTFPDGPAGSIVSVSVSDDDGGNGTGSVSATVRNVAPTVVLEGRTTTNEGNAETFAFTVSDPGADTFTLASFSCGTSGTGSNLVFDTASGAGSFQCTFPDGPAASTVSVQVRDSDGADSNFATIAVAISDGAPALILTGPSNTEEGGTERYSFVTTDPGPDTISVLLEGCGDNASLSNSSFDPATGAGSFDCSFADGPANSTVQVQVRDSDGANSNAATITVAIANVAPTVAVSGPTNADEGQTLSYSFVATDPGLDTFSLLSPNCGAIGTISNPLLDSTTGVGSFDCTFIDGPASSIVSVQVADSDGASSNAATLTVAVANLPPVVTLSGPTSAAEGQSQRYSFAVSDPGQDDFSLVSTSCGTGGTLSGVVFDGITRTGSFNCTFPDGPDSSTVVVRVTDSDNDAGNPATIAVTITNVAPIVTLTGPTVAAQGHIQTYSFTVSDPGVDVPGVASQSCGSGGLISNPAFDSATGAGSFDCTFPIAPATNQVSVQAVDSDGDASSNTARITVAVVTETDLGISLTDSPDPVIAGQDLTYTATVSNAGPSAATKVTFTNTLPPGVNVVAANVGMVHLSATIGSSQEVPTNPSTASGTATLTYDPVAASFDIDTFVQGIGLADLTGSHLHLARVGINGPVIFDVGGSLQWNVDGPGIRRVVTRATFSDGAGFTAAQKAAALLAGDLYFNMHTRARPGGEIRGQLVGAGSPDCNSSAGTVSCALGTLAPGDSSLVTISVAVNATTRATLSNRSNVSASEFDPSPTNNSDTEDTAVVALADLSVDIAPAPGPVTAGQNLTYSVTVSNAGPSTAMNVSLTDTLPVGVSLVSAAAGGANCSFSAGAVTCPVATLVPRGSTTVTITVAVDPATRGILTNSASVTGIESDPSPANNADAEVTSVAARADLAVGSSTNADPVIAGENLTYTVTVSNAGPSTATGVSLSDALPPGVNVLAADVVNAGSGSCSASAGLVTCALGTLAPAASSRVTITVAVDPNTRGLIQGSVSASAIEVDSNLNNNSVTQTTAVATRTDLAVAISDSPNPVIAGRNLVYTVTVSNAGPSTATNVNLIDTLPTGVTVAAGNVGACSVSAGMMTCELGTLAPGVTRLGLITLAVPADGRGVLTNRATVSGDESDPDLTNNSDTEETAVAAQADLRVIPGDSPDPVIAGQDLVYTVRVANAGPSTATNVSVLESLPPGARFVPTGSPGCGLLAGTVSCPVGSMAPGDSTIVTVAVAVDPTARGTLTNGVVAFASELDPFPGDNAATENTAVAASADLAISQSDSPDPVIAGQNVIYTVTVRNDGPSEATNVSLSDSLPAGVSRVSINAGAAACSSLAGTVSCAIGTLAPGSGTTLTITVTVVPATLGTLTNSLSAVAVETDPSSANNSATQDTNTVARASLRVSTADGETTITAGAAAMHTYTITVTNAGPSDAAGVTLSDTWPSGLKQGTITPPVGASCTTSTGKNFTCDLGTLASGTSKTVTVSYTVPITTLPGLQTNLVTVSSVTSDPDSSDNAASDTTGVIEAAESSPGNVTARRSRGVLTIRGDRANNAILIVSGAAAGCPTGLCIRGLRGTKIGGQSGPVAVVGATHLTVQLGKGNDSVYIVGMGSPVQIAGNLRIDTGDGDDAVELESVTVGGRGRIEGGRGNDRITVLDAVLSGAFRLNSSSGNDQVRVTNSQFLAPVVMLTRSGTDLLAIEDCNFKSRVTLDRAIDLSGLR